ncbi:MAG: beta 1-4 rhamnosyltransferase Cps2T [Roseburia sp.]
MKDVFIIGSKGIPARYGGFETFVENLTRGQKSSEIRYHVACMEETEREFVYNGANCFSIKPLPIGPARAVCYDLAAFSRCLKQIRREQLKDPVVYVLACRIGPFTGFLKRRLKRLGGTLYVNPDGHEFKRAKWNRPIRAYWRFSERLMVKHADKMICDSKNMEQYIRTEYECYQPDTMFLAYGTNVKDDFQNTGNVTEWLQEHDLQEDGYYLVVGRFVPENNYETMLREFMASDTTRNLVLITNVEENDFYRRLKEETHFDRDPRIKFVGTVYDETLLARIRSMARGYLHGHEVGGTNPSLLEALATTKVNLLLDVGFNREVGEDGALYWTKEAGSLRTLLHQVDKMDETERQHLADMARKRMREHYSWESIVEQYEKLFLAT